MAAKKKAAVKKTPAKKAGARRKAPVETAAGGKATPILFRMNIEVGNLELAQKFYGNLFQQNGRVAPGSRVYFNAGGVTLQVLDVSPTQAKPHTAAKALYFLVKDLDKVYGRAKQLNCLTSEVIHGEPGGEIRVRPWGERSFYVEDPWQNPLCFVEAGTVYPG